MVSKHADKLVRFSNDVREALIFAEAEREIARHDCLTTGHLLLGFFHLDAESTNKLIRQGVTRQKLRSQVYRAIQQAELEQCRGGWSNMLLQVFQTSQNAAQVETKTVLLTLLGLSNSIAQRVLMENGVTSEKLHA